MVEEESSAGAEEAEEVEVAARDGSDAAGGESVLAGVVGDGGQEAVVADSAAEAEEAGRSAVFGVLGAQRLELPSGGAHSHVLQAWRGRIDPPVTTWEALGALEAEGAALDFALPDGSQAPLLFKRVERFGAGKGVLVAKVEDRPFAEAYFSYVNAAVSGVVRFPDAGVSWEIRDAGDGGQVFEQVDLAALGECGVCRPAGGGQ